MGDHIFFHIDVNSAFLSWTALSLLQEGSGTDLRLIPSIVVHASTQKVLTLAWRSGTA